MNYCKLYEGKYFKTKDSTLIKIIKYIAYNDVIIEFENGYTKHVQLAAVKKGTIRDMCAKSLANTGYIGRGNYNSNKDREPYKRWSRMILRCYDSKDKDYKNYGAIGATVCEEWHNFQNYAKWFYENCKDPTYVVDKDILIKGNLIYSPETCRFVPVALNSIFVDNFHGDLPYGVKKKTKRPGYEANIRKHGKRIYLGYFKTIEEAFNKYKQEKEAYIKELANIYKDSITEDISSIT